MSNNSLQRTCGRRSFRLGRFLVYSTMLMHTFRLIALAGILFAPVLAAQAPHLTGAVDLDLPRGLIAADVCVSNLPEGDTLHFVLNRGLNIKSIRNAAGATLPFVGDVKLQAGDVGLRYAVRDTTKASGTLCIAYTGAYPIYNIEADTFRSTDHSGVIAFNGRTVRARGETFWYPVVYAPATDRLHGGVSYTLRVRCPTCAAVYLNGSPPKRGLNAEFRSAEPREAILFAGEFPVVEVGGSVFLGEQIAADTARAFLTEFDRIARFYEDFLKVPYGRGAVFIRVHPVRRERYGQLWGFFAWPTFGLAGLNFGDFATILQDTAAARAPLLGFLAHEMAHYYFGTVLSSSGAYEQFYSEPFANYLGLKAVRRFIGEDAYRSGLRTHYQNVLAGPELPSLDRADRHALSRDLYRYQYGPLLLFALEREIGEARMRALLHTLLTAPDRALADYAFLRRKTLEVGVPAAVWERFEQRCVQAGPQAPCLAEFAR